MIVKFTTGEVFYNEVAGAELKSAEIPKVFHVHRCNCCGDDWGHEARFCQHITELFCDQCMTPTFQQIEAKTFRATV